MLVERIERLRRDRTRSARRIAGELAADGHQVSVSTVGRWLVRLGINRRRLLDPTGADNRTPPRASWPATPATWSTPTSRRSAGSPTAADGVSTAAAATALRRLGVATISCRGSDRQTGCLPAEMTRSKLSANVVYCTQAPDGSHPARTGRCRCPDRRDPPRQRRGRLRPRTGLVPQLRSLREIRSYHQRIRRQHLVTVSGAPAFEQLPEAIWRYNEGEVAVRVTPAWLH